MAEAAAASYFLAPNLSGCNEKPLLVFEMRGNGDATVKKLRSQELTGPQWNLCPGL
jgi:hypothetical protein